MFDIFHLLEDKRNLLPDKRYLERSSASRDMFGSFYLSDDLLSDNRYILIKDIWKRGKGVEQVEICLAAFIYWMIFYQTIDIF